MLCAGPVGNANSYASTYRELSLMEEQNGQAHGKLLSRQDKSVIHLGLSCEGQVMSDTGF